MSYYNNLEYEGRDSKCGVSLRKYLYNCLYDKRKHFNKVNNIKRSIFIQKTFSQHNVDLFNFYVLPLPLLQ